jgi:hypothetical protein
MLFFRQIKRAVYLWRLKWVRQSITSFEQTVPYERNWKYCELVANNIDLDKIRHYNPSLTSVTIIRSCFKTLDGYQNFMEEIVKSLTYERKIDWGWGTLFNEDISLNGFLRSEDGYYLSPEAIVVFLKNVKTLCELISQFEDQDTGVNAHNVRTLTHFFTNLRVTLLDLFDLQFAL